MTCDGRVVMDQLLLILGAVCFVLALIPVGKFNWVALGLLFWILTALI